MWNTGFVIPGLLVLAIQMFYSVVSLVGSLLIDISYGLVDPRVRVDK